MIQRCSFTTDKRTSTLSTRDKVLNGLKVKLNYSQDCDDCGAVVLRLSLKIPMARPNEPGMQSKCTKTVLLDVYHTQIRPRGMISWPYQVSDLISQDIRTG